MRPIAGLVFVVLLAAPAVPALAAPAVRPAAPASQPDPEPGVLSLEEMQSASGGQGVSVDVMTRQQLTATTSGNTVTAGAVNSGDVNFDANSLSGFNGVGNFVVNTGANNTLQGAINISIVTAPAG